MDKNYEILSRLRRKLVGTDFKLLYVGRASWVNVITKQNQEVKNIWFLGYKSSERPLIITNFTVSNGEKSDKYIITDRYSHTNLSYTKYSQIVHIGDETIEFYGQELCSPIAALHILEGNSTDMKNLIKATLLSQNFDDAYSEVNSVNNGYKDLVVCDTNINITLNNSPIELLTGLSSSSLRKLECNDLNSRLRSIKDLDDFEVWAKLRSDGYYSKVSKSFIEEFEEKLSKYYPVFDKNAIDNMITEIPKDYYELGVYGLGSAGTAILDQLCRSNWIRNIYLCDFDYVEPKNMINQWYTNTETDLYKTTACSNLIKRLNRTMPHGISTKFRTLRDNSRFEESEYETKRFKYLVSGFDTCKTRQDFLAKVITKDIEADYLIDCRYLDLACSVYFIDLHNEEEVSFYKANLDMDAELINRKNSEFALNEDEFDKWVERKDYYNKNCSKLRERLCGDCRICSCGNDCRSEKCKKFLYELYQKSLPNNWISVSDASCVKYNYIDIYKYVGAIVFSAVREIENGAKKPFTLIEAQTGGIPKYMVVKE